MSELPPTTHVPDEGTTDEPVRMKVYGLFSMTQRGYLLAQVGLFLAVLVMLAVCYWALPPTLTVAKLARQYAPWALAIIVVGEAAETLVVLGKFKQKRAETHRADGRREDVTPEDGPRPEPTPDT